MLEPGAKVQKLEDGFFSISGAAVDAAGKLYFVDHHEQRIYGWSRAEGLTVERDNPLDPVNLAFDKSGNLLVLSSAGPEGTVYSFRPGSPKEQVTVLPPQPTRPHPGARAILPVNYWNNGEFKDQLDFDTFSLHGRWREMFRRTCPRRKRRNTFRRTAGCSCRRDASSNRGRPTPSRAGDSPITSTPTGFVSGAAGERIYVSSESEDITYRAMVNADGTLGELQPFAQRGGESVAVDAKGNVYVANGQIFVYDPAGKQIGRIDVPERPIDIVFGGAGGRTLFILAHHALFAVRVRG